MKYLDIAMLDLKKASLQYNVWLHLGLLEVKQRYRRSVLGPWWISISMLIFIVAMGKIFSQLFNQRLADYIPFLQQVFYCGLLFLTILMNQQIYLDLIVDILNKYNYHTVYTF